MNCAFNIDVSAVETYREGLRHYLRNELDENGGSFEKWFDELSLFREYIMRNYVRIKAGKELYVYIGKRNKYGDKIDHHIVSYLAPLCFYRVGWNGMKLRPFEQIKILSDGMDSSALVTGGGGQKVDILCIAE